MKELVAVLNSHTCVRLQLSSAACSRARQLVFSVTQRFEPAEILFCVWSEHFPTFRKIVVSFCSEFVLKTMALQSYKTTVITPRQLNHHRAQERLNAESHIMHAIFVLRKTQVMSTSAGD